MRIVAALILALAGLVGTAPSAAASCIPLSLDEKIRMAEIIAYGTVEGDADPARLFGARTVTFRAQRVFKGALPAVAQVRIGPQIEGGPGGATSVDYRATKGDHVLYLRAANAAYETSDCSGSHAGAPTSEELRILGTGSPPGPAALGDELTALGVLPIAAALALGALVVFVARARLVKREGQL